MRDHNFRCWWVLVPANGRYYAFPVEWRMSTFLARLDLRVVYGSWQEARQREAA